MKVFNIVITDSSVPTTVNLKLPAPSNPAESVYRVGVLSDYHETDIINLTIDNSTIELKKSNAFSLDEGDAALYSAIKAESDNKMYVYSLVMVRTNLHNGYYLFKTLSSY